jgi:hypothetical protein
MLAGISTPSPRTAWVIATMWPRSGEVDFSRSDEAQQLSACACARVLSESEMSDWPPRRMGHVPFSQHAIRASGVAAHPGHTPTFPRNRAIASTTVDRRCTNRTAAFRMRDTLAWCQACHHQNRSLASRPLATFGVALGIRPEHVIAWVMCVPARLFAECGNACELIQNVASGYEADVMTDRARGFTPVVSRFRAP